MAGDAAATVPAECNQHEGDPRSEPARASATDERSVPDTQPPGPSPPPSFTAWPRLHSVDLVVALALFVLALVARHGSLPNDGLIFDDAWVATGAMKASIGELLAVSLHHPGFTALLMGWARVMPQHAEWMALPAYVGGAAAAPVLYLVTRRFEVPRTVGLLVAGLVVTAPAHVYYSGRVKTYVIDGTVILILALVLPLLARRRWEWSTVALWVGASVLVGTFSVFALMAVAAATTILALHPAGDRPRRWAALGIQALIQLAYLATVSASFDSAEVATDLEREYDAYIEPTVDVVSMGRQIGAHVARLGDAIASGNRPLAGGITLLALAGLAWEAWRGSRSLVARFLLVLPGIALAGSLVRQMPFGPNWGNPVFPGTRATLWLLPSLAVGLAFGIELVSRGLRRALPSIAPVLPIVLVVVTGVVLSAKVDDRLGYLDSGAASARRFVEERAGDRDLIVVLPNATWHYAAQPGVRVQIQPAPETGQGFVPRLVDPRMWVQTPPSTWDGSVEQLERRLNGAPRVFILNGFAGVGDQAVPRLEAALASLGYRQRPGFEASVFEVSLWARDSG